MIENDCYKCKWRGTIPGDAHSRCTHPDLKGAGDDVFAGIMAMFASVGRTSPQIHIQAFLKKFEIRADPHGIKKGWFNWPWNFDPAWLENCNAFELAYSCTPMVLPRMP
jgi:hypothetical protein